MGPRPDAARTGAWRRYSTDPASDRRSRPASRRASHRKASGRQNNQAGISPSDQTGNRTRDRIRDRTHDRRRTPPNVSRCAQNRNRTSDHPTDERIVGLHRRRDPRSPTGHGRPHHGASRPPIRARTVDRTHLTEHHHPIGPAHLRRDPLCRRGGEERGHARCRHAQRRHARHRQTPCRLAPDGRVPGRRDARGYCREMNDDPLFTPLRVNTRTVDNRFVLPAMQRGSRRYRPSEVIALNMRAAAEGGSGTIIFEGSAPDHPALRHRGLARARPAPQPLGLGEEHDEPAGHRHRKRRPQHRHRPRSLRRRRPALQVADDLGRVRRGTHAGDFDFIGVGRTQIANPDFVDRVRRGDLSGFEAFRKADHLDHVDPSSEPATALPRPPRTPAARST